MCTAPQHAVVLAAGTVAAIAGAAAAAGLAAAAAGAGAGAAGGSAAGPAAAADRELALSSPEAAMTCLPHMLQMLLHGQAWVPFGDRIVGALLGAAGVAGVSGEARGAVVAAVLGIRDRLAPGTQATLAGLVSDDACC